MFEFPTPASQVGRDILQRLCAEWQQTPSEQLNIHATNKNEAVKLLSDSNSDMVKLLKELGWQQPSAPTQDDFDCPAEPGPSHDSLSLGESSGMQGMGSYDRESY